MKKSGIVVAVAATALLTACANTPQQQREVGCVGAGVAGALAGAAVGSQLGGGTGRDILMAGGAVAGGLAGNNAAGC
ncbi:hypothetical protein [Roseobacter sinensis]|uniref:17 kDa surface antigen n=1 Tax=Roseobacter sinensis TaxID=2931391 RepID=A0ABT3BFS8_9RHOB|nr:hypothetical protein [Roseobacter sp. WL0113]MCV3272441.1 hypothetical protein [Roseobacter sp. WL0113]